MNHEAVCRTAPATPGLSITQEIVASKLIHWPFKDKANLENFRYLCDEGLVVGPSTEPESFWLLWASLCPFHQSGIISFSSKLFFNKARIMLGIGGLSLTNPSTRNHLFLLQGALNRLEVSGLLLDIPFNRLHLCPLQCKEQGRL